MFTGIVEGRGTVLDVVADQRTGLTRLVLDTHGLTADLGAGGSLAVDGVCLTALDVPDRPEAFAADVMGETLARTSLGALRVGDKVNLERCVPATGRLDGHVVQGHVDSTGSVLRVAAQGAWTRLRVGLPAGLAGQVACKGAVAVDGVSLTVSAVSPPEEGEPWFEVSLVPATLASTGLGDLEVGDQVNIETDVMAKYLQRMLEIQEVRR